jgi:hypothetical protein
MPTDDDLTKAIQLIKAGRKPEAQLVLEPYIQAYPQNIQAWMWETELFPNDCDKIRVLEICLEHNPDHPQVMRALAMLQSRSGDKPVVATPAPPPAPAPFYQSAPAAVSSEPAVNFQKTGPRESVPSAAKKPVLQKQAPAPVRPRKHPDWLTTEGVVNASQVREVQGYNSRTYMAQIEAIYVVKGRDYTIKHPRAKRGSFTPFDLEILVTKNPTGKGVTVSYDPKKPAHAWVDEWDSSETNRQLKEFKEKPEVRQVLSKRYRSMMLSGIGWIVLGVVLTVGGTMLLIPLGFAYVAFTGAIAYGIISFLIGLVGWMWHWD